MISSSSSEAALLNGNAANGLIFNREEMRVGTSNLFITGVHTLADYFLNKKNMNDETAATSIEHRGPPTTDSLFDDIEESPIQEAPPSNRMHADEYDDVQVLDIDNRIDSNRGFDDEEELR